MAPFVVGVISDTHGLLRPGAVSALHGVDHIIHAGDIESAQTLEELRALAPLTAVCGNCDRGPWAKDLPSEAVVELGGCRMVVVHDLARLSLDPKATGIAVVVSGHTHTPCSQSRDGVLYFNPGSAGPRRHGKPIGLGRLTIDRGVASGELLTLWVDPASR
jgi:putative phosphoesterase